MPATPPFLADLAARHGVAVAITSSEDRADGGLVEDHVAKVDDGGLSLTVTARHHGGGQAPTIGWDDDVLATIVVALPAAPVLVEGETDGSRPIRVKCKVPHVAAAWLGAEVEQALVRAAADRYGAIIVGPITSGPGAYVARWVSRDDSSIAAFATLPDLARVVGRRPAALEALQAKLASALDAVPAGSLGAGDFALSLRRAPSDGIHVRSEGERVVTVARVAGSVAPFVLRPGGGLLEPVLGKSAPLDDTALGGGWVREGELSPNKRAALGDGDLVAATRPSRIVGDADGVSIELDGLVLEDARLISALALATRLRAADEPRSPPYR